MLAEVIVLRTALLKALYKLGQGKRLTAEEIQRLGGLLPPEDDSRRATVRNMIGRGVPQKAARKISQPSQAHPRFSENHHRLAVSLSNYGAHPFASSVGADSQHKSELVPSAVIIGLVDAHSIHKQANDKCDRSDDSMPESTPEASRIYALLFVLGVPPSNGERIGHRRLQVYKRDAITRNGRLAKVRHRCGESFGVRSGVAKWRAPARTGACSRSLSALALPELWRRREVQKLITIRPVWRL